MKTFPQIVRQKYGWFPSCYGGTIQGERNISTIGEEEGVSMFLDRLFINVYIHVFPGCHEGIEMTTGHMSVRVKIAPAKTGGGAYAGAKERAICIMRIKAPSHRVAAKLNSVSYIRIIYVL